MSLATWPMAQLSTTPPTSSSRLPTDKSQLALPLAVKLMVLTLPTLQLKHDGRVAATRHDAGDAGAGVQTARLTIGWMSR